MGQYGLLFVIEVGPTGVDKPFGLLSDGLDHIGMTVAGGDGGDASDEVQKAVPVGILQIHSLTFGHHHGIGAGIRG